MRSDWLKRGLALGLALSAIGTAARGQASAMQSAQTGTETVSPGGDGGRGRKLLDEMVVALGGQAWVNRQNWVIDGKAATFYKGQPHEGVAEFEEYYRTQPFGERVVIISKLGVFIPTEHRDLAEVWTADTGYEISYKGKKELPVKDVADYQRRRQHTLEVVVNEWLRQPGVLVTYEGSNMEDRHLAEQVSVLTTGNDAVTLELDENTHLPLSISFQWRDPLYKDLNTDTQQFDDYHAIQGIMTPLTLTRLQNGQMVSQRFLTKVTYNAALAPDLFNPDRPLQKKTK